MLVGFVTCMASAGRGIPGAVYAGVFIAACGKQQFSAFVLCNTRGPKQLKISIQTLGIYPSFPGNITWLSSNLAGSYKRATGMAIQIGFGNLSGAAAANFYRNSDAPKYYTGHALMIGVVTAGMIAVLVLRINYQRINKRRDMEGTGDLTEEELADMGDKSPGFRYSL